MSAQPDAVHRHPRQHLAVPSLSRIAANHERVEADPVQDASLLAGILDMLGRRIAVYAGMRRVVIAERLGLSAKHLSLLDMVMELAPLSIGQLTRLSGLSSGSITTMLDRLEDTGMITRTKDQNDRRLVLLMPNAQRCALLEAPANTPRSRSGAAPLPDLHTLEQVHAFLGHYLGTRRNDALLHDGSDRTV